MQEIPPDLAGWLEEEERNAEEKEEDKGTRNAGEKRSDPHQAPNEFFDGEADGDNDESSVATCPKRGGTPGRKVGRRGRSSRAQAPPREEEDLGMTPQRRRSRLRNLLLREVESRGGEPAVGLEVGGKVKKLWIQILLKT